VSNDRRRHHRVSQTKAAPAPTGAAFTYPLDRSAYISASPTRCPLAGLRPVHSRSVSRSVHPTLSHDRVHFLGAFTRPHIEWLLSAPIHGITAPVDRRRIRHVTKPDACVQELLPQKLSHRNKIRYAGAWFDDELTKLEGAE